MARERRRRSRAAGVPTKGPFGSKVQGAVSAECRHAAENDSRLDQMPAAMLMLRSIELPSASLLSLKLIIGDKSSWAAPTPLANQPNCLADGGVTTEMGKL